MNCQFIRQSILLPVLWVLLCSGGCISTALPPVAETVPATLPISRTLTPALIRGATGIGDPYYPELGNGGYQVEHYTLVLDVQPMTNVISGTTTIRAQATQSLSTFNLDLAGLTIEQVLVNDSVAAYQRDGRELTITPVYPLPPNHEFTVVVAYQGSPQPILSVARAGTVGWFHAADGAINIMGEPDGAAAWFPANNHPRDKATYRFEITVPASFVVAASGFLRDTVELDEKIRYIWEMDKPMASYLAAINIDNYVVETRPGPDGVILRHYFPPHFPEASKRGYAKLPEMIEFFSTLFGPYPFAAYGVLIAEAESGICETILAIEIQTLSTHCPEPAAEEEEVIVHELVHQWFGNSVSIKNWQDLWLKEGLATYAQWLWRTRGKEITVVSNLAAVYRRHVRLATPIGQSLADDLYNYDTVYTGGALVFMPCVWKSAMKRFLNCCSPIMRAFRIATPARKTSLRWPKR
jgi:aminopeptidase N